MRLPEMMTSKNRPAYGLPPGGMVSHTLRGAALVGGASALAMFWLDPVSGRRRRTETIDRVRGACNQAIRTAARSGVRFSHRLRGALAEASRAFREGAPADGVLEQRVRSRIGLAAADARDLVVRARDGCIELVGSVPWDEHDAVVAAARDVAGVTRVVARLRPKDGERLKS